MCQATTSSTGKPAPSAMAVSFSWSWRRRRGAAGASVAAGLAVSGSAVTCSLTASLDVLLELLVDELVHVDRLAELFVLKHQLCVGLGALHEHVIGLPRQHDIGHRKLQRI